MTKRSADGPPARPKKAGRYGKSGGPVAHLGDRTPPQSGDGVTQLVVRIGGSQQRVQVLADGTTTVARVAEQVAESFANASTVVDCIMLPNGMCLPRSNPVLSHLEPGQVDLCCELAPAVPFAPPAPVVEKRVAASELLDLQVQGYLAAGRVVAQEGMHPAGIKYTPGLAVFAMSKDTHAVALVLSCFQRAVCSCSTTRLF